MRACGWSVKGGGEQWWVADSQEGLSWPWGYSSSYVKCSRGPQDRMSAGSPGKGFWTGHSSVSVYCVRTPIMIPRIPLSPFLAPRLPGSPWWHVLLCLGILQFCICPCIGSQFLAQDATKAHVWNIFLSLLVSNIPPISMLASCFLGPKATKN